MREGEVTFLTFEKHEFTVNDEQDALEILDELAEIASELPPNTYPLLKLIST